MNGAVEELYTAEDVARILRVRPSRVYELARLGLIGGVVRLGRQVRFRPDALSAWIAEGGTPLDGSGKSG